jgi:hypothetical protein
MEHGWRRWMAVAVAGHHRSRRGVGERGQEGCAGAPWECGDAFPLPDLVGDQAEGGNRRRGGSGSHRQ